MRALNLTMALILSTTTGCASILNNAPRTLDVTIDPALRGTTTTISASNGGATQTVAGTHFQIPLDRRSDYTLIVAIPLALLFGAIDPATGAWMEPDAQAINVHLTRDRVR